MAEPRSSATTEYVAALCHMRNGGLVDYVSERLAASSEAEAKQKAEEWAAVELGMIAEPIWVQMTDPKAIHSKPYGTL